MTRKILLAAGRIKLGLQDKLYLGNLDSQREWGHAKDYVEGMWLMLQADQAEDFIFATGKPHSIRQFLDYSFGYLDLNCNDYVEIDPRSSLRQKSTCSRAITAKPKPSWVGSQKQIAKHWLNSWSTTILD
ncbi:GDP-mannose 4,6-dehydratase [Mariniblastus sp.]|nr:GDP-mannose 4,6-dehydratase [Mariniblastus sp.]